MGKFFLGVLTGITGIAVAAVISEQLDFGNLKDELEEETEDTKKDASASSEKIIEANAPFLAEAIRKLKQAGNLF